MKRRNFLKDSGTLAVGAVAASTLAKPAIAQSSLPEIKWRCTSSFPKSLDTLYGGAEYFVKRLAELTDNKFQVQLFSAGEIVPGLQAADAVMNNTVEMCQTGPTYYWGKDPAFALLSCLPFGLNTRGIGAWWFQGGGEDLANKFAKRFGLHFMLCGNTGAQMGGFFRNEVKGLSDLKGMKYRIAGFGGTVFAKVGVVPQTIAGGDIYPALEKGTIDACEWIGPYDDEKLGFHKIAKYYYYPGWWEPTSLVHMFVNLEKWESLPKMYQNALKAASAEAYIWTLTKYDNVNPPALRRLLAGGVQLRSFSEEILNACFKGLEDTAAEMVGKSADFKAIYESMKAYRADQFLWQQTTEFTMDSFMILQQRNKKI